MYYRICCCRSCWVVSRLDLLQFAFFFIRTVFGMGTIGLRGWRHEINMVEILARISNFDWSMDWSRAHLKSNLRYLTFCNVMASILINGLFIIGECSQKGNQIVLELVYRVRQNEICFISWAFSQKWRWLRWSPCCFWIGPDCSFSHFVLNWSIFWWASIIFSKIYCKNIGNINIIPNFFCCVLSFLVHIWKILSNIFSFETWVGTFL